jgi:hypothetical protein
MSVLNAARIQIARRQRGEPLIINMRWDQERLPNLRRVTSDRDVESHASQSAVREAWGAPRSVERARRAGPPADVLPRAVTFVALRDLSIWSWIARLLQWEHAGSL